MPIQYVLKCLESYLIIPTDIYSVEQWISSEYCDCIRIEDVGLPNILVLFLGGTYH